MVDGRFQGVAFKNVDISDLYPTVSLHSPNEEVRFNLGQEPFKFDLESMITVSFLLIRKEQTLNDLKSVCEEPLQSIDVHKLVLGYLNHYAYLNTMESFVRESGIEKVEESLTRLKKKDLPPVQDDLGILKKHGPQYCPYSLGTMEEKIGEDRRDRI